MRILFTLILAALHQSERRQQDGSNTTGRVKPSAIFHVRRVCLRDCIAPRPKCFLSLICLRDPTVLHAVADGALASIIFLRASPT